MAFNYINIDPVHTKISIICYVGNTNRRVGCHLAVENGLTIWLSKKQEKYTLVSFKLALFTFCNQKWPPKPLIM